MYHWSICLKLPNDDKNMCDKKMLLYPRTMVDTILIKELLNEKEVWGGVGVVKKRITKNKIWDKYLEIILDVLPKYVIKTLNLMLQ